MGIGHSQAGVAGALVARPRLWPTALRQALALAPRRWWRSWPPRPAPTPGYAHFRKVTQYGRVDHQVAAGDVVAYLDWCRQGRARPRRP